MIMEWPTKQLEWIQQTMKHKQTKTLNQRLEKRSNPWKQKQLKNSERGSTSRHPKNSERPTNERWQQHLLGQVSVEYWSLWICHALQNIAGNSTRRIPKGQHRRLWWYWCPCLLCLSPQHEEWSSLQMSFSSILYTTILAYNLGSKLANCTHWKCYYIGHLFHAIFLVKSFIMCTLRVLSYCSREFSRRQAKVHFSVTIYRLCFFLFRKYYIIYWI